MRAHIPVMAKEAIEHLKLAPGRVIVDCTLGCGGHTSLILEQIIPGGKLIGIDQDDEALRIAEGNLKRHKSSLTLIQNNFCNIDSILKEIHIDKVDGMLFDLGVSSIHLDESSRGFSFNRKGPLDMRMDRANDVTAEMIVNRLPQERLESILREYGEERKARSIAQAIIERRKKAPIKTTLELANIIERVYGYRRRIHPATKSFLALRIAVNSELKALGEGLVAGINHLKSGARIVVISFNSLEDRIVKHTFRDCKQRGELKIITKSPLRPSAAEAAGNPRARSAKLRVGERI